MNSEVIFTNILRTKQSTIEGMRDHNWSEEDNYILTTNIGNPHLLNNFCYVKNQLSDEVTRTVQGIIQEDPTFKIVSQHDDLQILGINPVVYSLVYTTKLKIDYLSSSDFSIRKFSYNDTRDLRLDLRDFSEKVIALHPAPTSSLQKVDQTIGAIVHMQNGSIWILEDSSENTLAAVVISELDTLDSSAFAEIIVNNQKLVGSQVVSLLFGGIHDALGYTSYTSIIPNAQLELFQSMNFTTLQTLYVYTRS